MSLAAAVKISRRYSLGACSRLEKPAMRMAAGCTMVWSTSVLR